MPLRLKFRRCASSVEDIPLLAAHFADSNRHPGDALVTFSQVAVEMLKNYNWQCNVRELENVVLHAAAMCENVIYPNHSPARMCQVKEISAEPFQSIELAMATENK